MFKRAAQFMMLPEEVQEQAPIVGPLLNSMMLALIIIAPSGTLLLSLVASEPFFGFVNLLGLFISLVILGLLFLLHQGRIALVTWSLASLMLAATTAAAVTYQGIGSSVLGVYVLVIVGVGVLLQTREAIFLTTLLSIILVVSLYLVEALGILTYPPEPLRISDPFVLVVILSLAGWLLRYSVAYLNRARQQVEVSEQALTVANQKLEALNVALEARVATRTRALSLTAELGRRLSTILDRQELIREVVTQLQRAFHYYHVHIYLVDDEGRQLVMAGGTGQAGRVLLEREHTLVMGQGLVGQAAESNLPVLVPDVADAPGWLANPLLPETRAELAVPVARGEEVLGVLDVQHNVQGGLTEEDVELLQSIANQLAVALQNARLFEQVQRRAAQERLVTDIIEKIQNTTTVEQAMQVTVREVGHALQGQPAQVRLQMSRGD